MQTSLLEALRSTFSLISLDVFSGLELPSNLSWLLYKLLAFLIIGGYPFTLHVRHKAVSTTLRFLTLILKTPKITLPDWDSLQSLLPLLLSLPLN